MAARLLVMAMGLVSFALIARHLGVERFGAYALVVAALPLLATLVDLGIGIMAVREIARRPEDTAAIVSTTFTLLAGLSVAGALLVVLVLPLLPYEPEVRDALRLAAAGLVVLLLAAVPGVIFQSSLRLELQAVVDLVGGAASLGLIVLAIALDGGLQAIIGAWLGSVAAATVVSYVLALRLLRFRPSLDRRLAASLLRRALPVGLTFVAAAIHFRVDAVLLSLLAPIDEVGVYGVAFRFLEHGLFAPLLFMGALFPVLAGYLAQGDPRLESTVQRAFTLLLLLAVPAAVGILVLAEPLVELLVGGGYQASVTPLRVLAVAVLFAFLNPLFTNLLVAADLQARVLKATLLAIAVNVALNLVLIPAYGATGAAAATVVSEILAVTVVAVAAIRHTRVSLDWTVAARVVVAALVMGAVVAATATLPLAVPVLGGAAVYAGLVLGMRVVSPREVHALLRAD